MPARTARQTPENKERFRQLIQAKVEREKASLAARADEELPSWIAWALKPVISTVFDVERVRHHLKGKAGEVGTLLNVRLALPSTWVMINDLVLEPMPDEFIQLDHLVIGPPGIFLVETKAWEGTFLARNDRWRRKEGNRWVACSSPTRQSARHHRLFVHWLESSLGGSLPAGVNQWVRPNVMFTRAKWLRAESCSVPIWEDALAFGLFMRRQTRQELLRPELVDLITHAVVTAGPCERVGRTSVDILGPDCSDAKGQAIGEHGSHASVVSPRVEEGRTRQGRAYVKVHGSRQDAEAVRLRYADDGRHPGEIKKDRYETGAWYFYAETP